MFDLSNFFLVLDYDVWFNYKFGYYWFNYKIIDYWFNCKIEYYNDLDGFVKFLVY